MNWSAFIGAVDDVRSIFEYTRGLRRTSHDGEELREGEDERKDVEIETGHPEQ